MGFDEVVKACVVREKGADEVPLHRFGNLSAAFGICPQPLPVLIHEPGRLRARQVNAGNMPAAEPCHAEQAWRRRPARVLRHRCGQPRGCVTRHWVQVSKDMVQPCSTGG